MWCARKIRQKKKLSILFESQGFYIKRRQDAASTSRRQGRVEVASCSRPSAHGCMPTTSLPPLTRPHTLAPRPLLNRASTTGVPPRLRAQPPLLRAPPPPPPPPPCHRHLRSTRCWVAQWVASAARSCASAHSSSGKRCAHDAHGCGFGTWGCSLGTSSYRLNPPARAFAGAAQARDHQLYLL